MDCRAHCHVGDEVGCRLRRFDVCGFDFSQIERLSARVRDWKSMERYPRIDVGQYGLTRFPIYLYIIDVHTFFFSFGLPGLHAGVVQADTH